MVARIKNVLVLCTGNSCRSIIAEALLNAELTHCLTAYSSGVAANGRVNPNAKKVLEEFEVWKEKYHSKTLNTMMDKHYDLVVTVCGNAQESCPVFPGKTKVMHIGFADPDGKPYDAFVDTYHKIKMILLPKIKKILCD